MTMLNRNIAPPIKDAVHLDLHLQPCEYVTLDNSIPVYSINSGIQDVTLIELVFFAGNWYEDKNIVAGTTNFMLKNGTTKKSAFEINEHFEYYGAYLNRHCYNETANITLHSLNRNLNDVLPVIGEILTDCVFPEEELAIYKQIQKQRLEVNLKKCDFVANRLMDECLYGVNHPYGKYTSLADFDTLEREQMTDFYDHYYRKGRCIIFVAGKLPADIHQQLNNVFGHLPLNQTEVNDKQHILTPAANKKYNVINDENGVQGAIRVARPFPNRHHPDFIKVQVLNNIFGGFFGSRLMSNIREDKGYTYGIHSYFQNHMQQSAWVVSTEAGRDVCAATIAEIYKEMKNLREELVDEDELLLVRNFMMGSILGDLDGPFHVIARWKNYILNDLTEDFFYKSLNTIRSISATEIRDLAEKYLRPEEYYELVVV